MEILLAQMYIQSEEANVDAREQTIGMGKGQILIDVWKEVTNGIF